MLVADVGNTDVVFGVFDGVFLKHTLRVPSKKEEFTPFYEYKLQNFFLEQGIPEGLLDKAVLSSVVPELTELFKDILSRISKGNVIVVKSNIHPDVRVTIDYPDQLGTDLYANAVFAFLTSKSACIVVDFGTALTFTVVSNSGEILGVSIAPGLKTSVMALFSKTAQLPEVPLIIPKNVIGKNTVEAIQSGVLFGYEGLVTSLLRRIKVEIGGHCKVYATGGLSSVIPNLASEFDEIDVNLTLKGLQMIGEAW